MGVIPASASRRLLPLLLLAAALPLAASQKSVVMPLVAPSRWMLESEAKLQIQNLTKFGEQLAIDKELGVTSASRRVYRKGDVEVTAIFEEAADPSSAYALYTLDQNATMRPVEGADLAVANSSFALMTRGRYLVRVIRPQAPALSAHDLESLLVAIGRAHLSAQNWQQLPEPLPIRGLEAGTEKYVLGPASLKLALPSLPSSLIGFNDGAEIRSGAYVNEGETQVLIVISYPTPQIAIAYYKNLSKTLEVNGAGGASRLSPRGASVYGRWTGSYALLVLNAKSAASARRLLDQFRSDQIVTQVPPYPGHDKMAVQLVKLIIANGELVMIIVVFAIPGGVFIYLAKRLIMKFFPNSSWIRPDEDMLIRLKLT